MLEGPTSTWDARKPSGMDHGPSGSEDLPWPLQQLGPQQGPTTAKESEQASPLQACKQCRQGAAKPCKLLPSRHSDAAMKDQNGAVQLKIADSIRDNFLHVVW